MGGIIYLLFGAIELLVGLRFVLLLLGANVASPFVSFIYNLSQPLVAPFAGILGQPSGANDIPVGGVFEWASLIALLVYGLIAGLIGRAVGSYGRRV